MDDPRLDRGTARTAAELRLQLAQMTIVSQVLGGSARDKRSRDYLALMDQSICRMLRIVERMEFSDRLGGEAWTRQEPELVDLSALTAELGERMAGLLAYTGVELTVETPERLGARAHRWMIRQMLMELVSNGAKAGRHVTLNLTQQGDLAVFTVEDDGPGIPPERLAHLFFSEEEAVPDWRRGGVGIAIARRVATIHGGTLVADCAEGRGLRAVASIRLGVPRGAVLESGRLGWDAGGFSDELVILSDLLPREAFGPDSE